MGTLLRLVPPGRALPEEAFGAEVAYYLEHHLEGRDRASLADLRRRCAEVAGVSVEVLMDALRFEAWEDAAPALQALRADGLRLVVVSNWDCSLGEVLASVGLRELVDAVVTSAEVGAAKPDPRIFAAGLEAAGCAAAEAIHVGDSLENDVVGAEALGIRAVLLDRDGGRGIGSLAELPALLG